MRPRPLSNLGARAPSGLRPWTPSRKPPVTLAAEDAPGSTAEAVQISTFLSNEAEKLRRDTAAESDKVRRETTAAIQALSQNVAQLSERMAQQNSLLAEKMSQQAEKLTGLDSTIKAVSRIAGGLGLGAILLMYLRSVYTQ